MGDGAYDLGITPMTKDELQLVKTNMHEWVNHTAEDRDGGWRWKICMKDDISSWI
jgi:hypothetical protein